MKGVIFAVAGLFWIICLILIFMAGDIGLRIGGGKATELPVKIDIYSMQNALDASKTYINTSLRYSLYQACYDNLINGGWNDADQDYKFTVSGKEYTKIAPDDKFKEQLESSIIETLNKYAIPGYSFIADYYVALPAYSEVTFSDLSESSVALSAKSDKNIYIEKSLPKESTENQNPEEPNIKESVILSKPSQSDAVVKTNCFGLYSTAFKESSSITDKINADIKSEVDALLGSAEKKKDWNECNVLITDAEKRVSDKIDDLSTNEKTVKPIEVKIMLSLDVGSGMVKGDDGMYTCKFKEDGESTAAAEVSISGPADKTFPVWNGKELSFEPLVVSFAVQSSYKATPSSPSPT